MDDIFVIVFFTWIILFMGMILGARMQQNTQEPRPKEEIVESIEEKLDLIDEDLDKIKQGL